MFKITDDNISMEDLLATSPDFEKPKLGTVVNGTVVSVRKNHLVILTPIEPVEPKRTTIRYL